MKLEELRDYANYVKIQHSNGTTTGYWHMQNVYVKYGQTVEAGQAIGTVGNTGYSTACHLHLILWEGKTQIDPGVIFYNPIGDSRMTEALNSYLSNVSPQNNKFEYLCGYKYLAIDGANVNDGSQLWRGGIIYNSYRNKSILVKNGIWDVYINKCQELELPKLTTGWVNGIKYSNHYTEVEAGRSPQSTGGWFQQFEKGAIYFNDKQWKGFAVYGQIYLLYEGMYKGTVGSYGFPTGEVYFNNQKKTYCQHNVLILFF